MIKVDIAKDIIKRHIKNATCGIFNTRNMFGDPMETIYSENGLTVDICYPYEYFEVFGLTQLEFEEVQKYYYKTQLIACRKEII